MLVDLKKTTAALTLTATTTPTFLQGRGLEQQKTKPSSPSLFSATQFAGAGARQEDSLSAAATPTKCSTPGSPVNVCWNHVAVAFPATSMPATTSMGVGNNMLQSMGEAGIDTSTGCSAHVLSWPSEDPGARTRDVDTDRVGISDVLTNIGGVSLFLELCVDALGEMLEKMPLKEVVCNEGVVDSVLTHIGSSSLFLELGTRTHQDLQGQVDSNHGVWVPRDPFGTMIVKLEKVQCVNIKQYIHSFGHTRLELTGYSDVVLNYTRLWPTEEMDRLSSPWDPGDSRFPCLVLNSKKNAGYTTGYFMHKLLRDSAVWEDNKSVLLAVELFVQWDPGIIKISMHAKSDIGKLVSTLRQLLNSITGNRRSHSYPKLELVIYNSGYTSCSTPVLSWPRDDLGANTQDDTDMFVEVMTHIGGLSLFQELGVDASDAMAKLLLVYVVRDDEIADQVLTHVGSSSLFIEIGRQIPWEHVLGGVAVVFPLLPPAEGMLQQLLLREMQQHEKIIAIIRLPWDQGKHELLLQDLAWQPTNAGEDTTPTLLCEREPLQWSRMMQLRSSKHVVKSADDKVLGSFGRDGLKKLYDDNFPEWMSFQQFEQMNWMNKYVTKLWPFVSQAATPVIQERIWRHKSDWTPRIWIIAWVAACYFSFAEQLECPERDRPAYACNEYTPSVCHFQKKAYSRSDMQLAHWSYSTCNRLNWIILHSKQLRCSTTFSTIVIVIVWEPCRHCLSPVFQELWLVWQKKTMFRRIGVAVVSVLCLIAAMAAMACFFMARALWRAGSREAAHQGDLMRHKEALQQAERKSMNKSNAFTSASHDIRSSLAAIAGLIDVSRTEARANPNLTYYLDQMEIGTKKLFDILNTILDISKVESGKMQLEEVQFSMADVLEESMDMANVVGMSRGIEVVWDPCDFSVLRCDAVIGDCKRFKQILDNLLDNAIKFTQDGHIMLRAWANRPIAGTSMISTPSRFAPHWRASVFYRWLLRTREDGAEQNARRSVQNDPNYLEFYFEVVDTGIGIPKEKRQSVFEKYVQVKEGHGGTGLGLGIVQSFVRLMGGEISIKDKEPGEAGTCFGFNVFLRISDAEEHIEHGKTAPSLFKEPGCFKGGPCVILVHGAETRRILQTWMENVGMKVWSVPRAELLAPTVEKARAAMGASPSRPASISSSQGGSDDLDGVADRCFSPKEMVTKVMRNSSGNHAGHLRLFGLLVIVDVSGGRLNEILEEAPSVARIKHQVPCRVACITNLKTSSEDLIRLKEAAICDMDLRKPIHGSRLRKLLQVMRELQASPFPQQHSHQVGITINEPPAADQATAASSEITYAAVATAVSSETTFVAAVPQEPLKLEDDKPLEGKRVLLVEDMRVLQFIQKKMLSTLGATVVVVADGSEAVAMFINALEIASGGAASEGRLALPYDMIFMDCQMPVMDGYKATKRIRDEESRYGIHTPIIALTAHSEEEDLQKTIQAGMDLQLTKPIQKEKVVEAVHQVWKEDNS
ncbi:uncharacterized protein LOC124680540 [Lolium rigidum]|uniref:uncharacterized protein LOC124680540 n=1 Tax=Lolium rigidum TaxID=89674 RepID=UPI001F5CB974|nr:uncharacterized protein LOC124680540 [Lolium rigidum]